MMVGRKREFVSFTWKFSANRRYLPVGLIGLFRGELKGIGLNEAKENGHGW
jgi:hypothetical protein